MNTYYFCNNKKRLLKIKQQKWLSPAHKDLGGTYHSHSATIIFSWNALRPVHSFQNTKGGKYQDLRRLCFYYQSNKMHTGIMGCRARNRSKHPKLIRVRAKKYKSLTSVWFHKRSTLKGRVGRIMAVWSWGGQGMGSHCSWGRGSVWEDGKALERDGSNGCTTMWTCLMS